MKACLPFFTSRRSYPVGSLHYPGSENKTQQKHLPDGNSCTPSHSVSHSPENKPKAYLDGFLCSPGRIQNFINLFYDRVPASCFQISGQKAAFTLGLECIGKLGRRQLGLRRVLLFSSAKYKAVSQITDLWMKEKISSTCIPLRVAPLGTALAQ